MILGTFIKQPQDVLDYDVKYDEFLTENDGVLSSVAVATPDTIQVDSVFTNEKKVKVWLSSGVAGVKYKIEVTTTTEDGRIKQDEFYVLVKEF